MPTKLGGYDPSSQVLHPDQDACTVAQARKDARLLADPYSPIGDWYGHVELAGPEDED